MDTRKKPAPGWHRETGLTNASDSANDTPIRARLKALIVCAACWGLLPIDLADFLIQRGGLNHD